MMEVPEYTAVYRSTELFLGPGLHSVRCFVVCRQSDTERERETADPMDYLTD